MVKLKDKVVFITGASSGIGAACAQLFAEQGAKLLLCSRHSQKIQKFDHAEHYCFDLDVRDSKKIKEVFSQLPSKWQNIDILINNAGLAAGLDFLQDGNITDWEEMIDTNIKGLLYITREILPGMVKRNSGHVINIGSISGHDVYPKGAVYCVTKHAVNVLSRGLRMDVLGTDIRVSSVDPGLVETNFSMARFKGDVQKAKEVYKNMTPLSAEDVADAVVYCATRPQHVNISEIIIMPTDQASVSLVSRK